MAMPTTRERVPTQTAQAINERIEEETAGRVRYLASHPEHIGEHLRELDAEWDVERAIEANASTLAFFGVALGYFVHPYWLVLPALVAAFLFQHAIQGWCPPIPVLRRLGFRTVHEIEREHYALKAVRGDFDAVAGATDKARAAVLAVNK